MPALTHYYVWYRIAGDPAAAHAAVAALLHDVFRHAGVMGRVLVRRDDPRIWMEIYEQVTDAPLFEHALAKGVLHHELARFAEGGARHTEPFVAAV